MFHVQMLLEEKLEIITSANQLTKVQPEIIQNFKKSLENKIRKKE